MTDYSLTGGRRMNIFSITSIAKTNFQILLKVRESRVEVTGQKIATFRFQR